MDEYRTLIDLFANDRLNGFINVQKLIGSAEFSHMAEYAAVNAINHSDYRYIAKLLKMLAGTQYFYSAVGWFCKRAALEYKDVAGIATFSRSLSEPDSGIKIRDVIKAKPPRLRPSPKTVATLPGIVVTTRKPKKRLKKVDVLDSWARLPGSFGAGKKR